jgi:enamine deaminase RidA (YjgF/YER057c/UK114 family)
MAIERLGSDPPGRYEAAVGYARVVRAGAHVWVAGCTSVDEHDVVLGVTPGAVFADVRPVTAMLEVSGFIDPRMLVEIEADAYVDRDSARQQGLLLPSGA